MPDVSSNDDRRWRRSIEQQLAQRTTSSGTAGPHDHNGVYSPVGHTHGTAAHTHPESDVTNLTADLAAKASATHNHDQAYATANHTHAAQGGVTVAKVAADQQSILVALADATGMGFAVAANTAYEFEYLLVLTSAATTTGWQLGFTGPASPTMFVAACEYQSSATAWTTATLTALGNFPLVTAAYAANTPIIVRIKGVLVTAAGAGSLQLRFATEVAASAVTLKRGSTLMYA